MLTNWWSPKLDRGQLYLLLCSVSLQDVDRHGAPQHRILCDTQLCFFVFQCSRPTFYHPFTQDRQVGSPLTSAIPLGFDILSENGMFRAFFPRYVCFFHILRSVESHFGCFFFIFSEIVQRLKREYGRSDKQYMNQAECTK